MTLHRYCALTAVLWAAALIVFGSTVSAVAAEKPGKARKPKAKKNLVIVVDGLRPDYITDERMPNLYALSRRGVFAEDHHAVFPTVTRVNASSFSTGVYPSGHGLLGNEIYLPEVDAHRTLDTSDYHDLIKIEEATGGQLLTAPTLAQILEAHTKNLLAISSGSTGSAYLLNHETYGVGVIHPELMVPETLQKRVINVIGPPPKKEGYPATELVYWTVAAYVKLALVEFKPDLTMLWITEPDHTAHKKGLGSPEFRAALAAVDTAIGNILSAIVERGQRDDINIIVTSDHGFSTNEPAGDLAALLIQSGLKASPSSTDVVVAGSAIHVKDRDEAVIEKIVRLLQKTDWVGPIFTRQERPGHPEGFVSGTLSFTLVHWDHERSGDILLSPIWSSESRHGFRGVTRRGGVAGHGSSSPHEIRATFIAAGPDFKSGARLTAPTGNVDLAPTLCRLFGIDPPEEMDGRVIEEAIVGGPDPEKVRVTRRTYESRATVDGVEYTLKLKESAVNGTQYLDQAAANRKQIAAPNAEK